ncbi:unnamed protein product [Phytomonas sp. Hart1]|nr:unnamed protein product [Phytomonas sp. Hart1]|eukprot:CCW66906.1 unnamed protein product [Phytomonas sp. isolate Hart1]
MSDTLSGIVNTLKGIYQSHDNDTRRQFTLQLEQLELNLQGEELVQIGISLLSGAADLAVLQAYGAVLLKKALRIHGIRVHKLPFWELLRWYATDAGLNNLLCADLEELLLTCAFRLPDGEFSRLLDRLLASNDLSQEPRRMRLIHGIVLKGVGPDLQWVPRARVGVLRGLLRERGPALLAAMNQTLFSIYSTAGGAISPGSWRVRRISCWSGGWGFSRP